MKALLDTHTVLWYLQGHSNLSVQVRETIEQKANVLYFSIASFWEIAIQSGLGKKNILESAQTIYVA